MQLRRKIAAVMRVVVGIYCFSVSWFSLMAFATISAHNTGDLVCGIVLSSGMLVSFPFFLFFLFKPRTGIYLQWSSFAVSVVAECWGIWTYNLESGRHLGLIGVLREELQPEHSLYIFSLSCALLLTLLRWLMRSARPRPQPTSEQS